MDLVGLGRGITTEFKNNPTFFRHPDGRIGTAKKNEILLTTGEVVSSEGFVPIWPRPLRTNEEILEAVKAYGPMSSEEEREQAISFAYGNARLANPNITKEDIRKAADELGF